jgi:hypothetical protein
VFVSDETGAANNVVASSQKTIAQASNDSTAPDKLSSSLIGDQLKIFRNRLPINPPIALPIPIPIKRVAALNPVRVNEETVDAPFTTSITELPSHAPMTNPISEKVLTSNPRRHPDTKMKIAKAIKIRSR